jgi:hypothetical protein
VPALASWAKSPPRAKRLEHDREERKALKRYAWASEPTSVSGNSCVNPSENSGPQGVIEEGGSGSGGGLEILGEPAKPLGPCQTALTQWGVALSHFRGVEPGFGVISLAWHLLDVRHEG